MISEETYFEATFQIQKQHPQVSVPAAFITPLAQLSNSDPAMNMRTPESFAQLKESIPALEFFFLGKQIEAGENLCPNHERLFHDVCGFPPLKGFEVSQLSLNLYAPELPVLRNA